MYWIRSFNSDKWYGNAQSSLELSKEWHRPYSQSISKEWHRPYSQSISNEYSQSVNSTLQATTYSFQRRKYNSKNPTKSILDQIECKSNNMPTTTIEFNHNPIDGQLNQVSCHRSLKISHCQNQFYNGQQANIYSTLQGSLNEIAHRMKNSPIKWCKLSEEISKFETKLIRPQSMENLKCDSILQDQFKSSVKQNQSTDNKHLCGRYPVTENNSVQDIYSRLLNQHEQTLRRSRKLYHRLTQLIIQSRVRSFVRREFHHKHLKPRQHQEFMNRISEKKFLFSRVHQFRCRKLYHCIHWSMVNTSSKRQGIIISRSQSEFISLSIHNLINSTKSHRDSSFSIWHKQSSQTEDNASASKVTPSPGRRKLVSRAKFVSSVVVKLDTSILIDKLDDWSLKRKLEQTKVNDVNALTQNLVFNSKRRSNRKLIEIDEVVQVSVTLARLVHSIEGSLAVRPISETGGTVTNGTRSSISSELNITEKNHLKSL